MKKHFYTELRATSPSIGKKKRNERNYRYMSYLVSQEWSIRPWCLLLMALLVI